MQSEARLRRGLESLSLGIEVNEDLALVRVKAAARAKERRNIVLAACVGVVALSLLLLAGNGVADAVLSIDQRFGPAQDPVEGRRDPITSDEGKGRIEARGGGSGTRKVTRHRGVVASRDFDRSPSIDGRVQSDPGAGADLAGSRTVKEDYVTEVPLGYGKVAGCASEGTGQSIGCVEFVLGDAERYVSISIEDRAGNNAFAILGIDADHNGKFERAREFCGSITSVEVPSGARLEIRLDQSPVPAGCTKARSGTVTAVLVTEAR